jgi:bifunctional non-homologous end joining protein LigD
MALDEYKKKRDFTKSPEPAGGAPRKKSAREPLFFCVQKHLASHLHYDLRLEWQGVLLSWAVPKGPSINPADKRLAMHVEDHPLEYGTFEGVIPEGYGAGIVMLWDQGTWEPEVDDVDAALRKGDLKFRLNGYKLKGSWVLVRTRGYGGRGGGDNRSWLLIKHRDEWSGPIDITEFAPLSVKTPDADFADILASHNPAVWRSNRPAQGGDTGKLFERIIGQALALKEGRTEPPADVVKADAKPAKSRKAKTATKVPRSGTTRAARPAKAPARAARARSESAVRTRKSQTPS